MRRFAAGAVDFAQPTSISSRPDTPQMKEVYVYMYEYITLSWRGKI